MKLSKGFKIIIGLFTIVPIIYMALFFASFFPIMSGTDDSFIFDNFAVLMIVHLMVMLLTFGLVAFYIVFLFKTTTVKSEIKALWAVVLFMGGPIAMPIFWYLYVWSEKIEKPDTQGVSSSAT